jgi:hypothetical protein
LYLETLIGYLENLGRNGDRYMANVTIRDVKQVYWARVIAQCKRDKIEKGVTVSQWCVDHGIREKSYWYYHKKLGNQLAEELLNRNIWTHP